MKATYTVILDREIDGRTIASVPGVPGCHAYGSSPATAVRRVKRALQFYLREVLREGGALPRQRHPLAVNVSILV